MSAEIAGADLIFENGARLPEAFQEGLPFHQPGPLGPTGTIPGRMTDSPVSPTPLSRSLRGSDPADEPAAEGAASADPAQSADPAPVTTPVTDSAPEPSSEGNGTSAQGGEPAANEEEIGTVTVVPYTATDAENVLREASKNMSKRFMTFYRIKPAADMLKNGPLGFDVLTFQPSDSSMAEKVCPRWACVLVSFFPEISQDIALDMMNRWQSNFGDIQEVCSENPRLMKKVEKAVDKVVRHYANDAFRFIDSLQVLCKLRRRYNPLSDIQSLLKRFFQEVDTCIEKTVESTMNSVRFGWNVEATTGTEQELPSEDSDGSD